MLAILNRYVVIPSAEAAAAVPLWIAATHAQDAWVRARLAIRAPEKRCGKSRLLDIRVRRYAAGLAGAFLLLEFFGPVHSGIHLGFVTGPAHEW